MNRIQIGENVTGGQPANNLMVSTNNVTGENGNSERIKKLNYEKFIVAKEIESATGLVKTALYAKLKEIERKQSELDPNWIEGRHIREVVGTVNKVAAPKDRTWGKIEASVLYSEDELPDWDEALLSSAPAEVISPPTAPVEVIAAPHDHSPDKDINGGTDLIIVPEFENLLPHHTPASYASLEKQIKDEGCRDAIVIWGKTIIDGHTRYKICKSNGLEFTTEKREFANISEAKIWIINNQNNRRNLTIYQKTALAVLKAQILSPQAKANQLSGLKQNHTVIQNSEKRMVPINITKEAAKYAQVSTDTASRVIKILDFASDEDKALLYEDKKSINEVYNSIMKNERLEHVKQTDNTAVNNGAWSQHNIELAEKNHVMYICPRYFKPDPEEEEVTIFNDLQCININLMVEDKATLFVRVRPHSIQKAKKLIMDWGFKYVESIFVTQSEYSFSTEYTEQIHDIIIICIRNGGIPVPATAKKIKSVIDDGQVHDAIINMYDKSCRIMKFCPSDPNEESKWMEQNIKDRIEGDEPASV